MFYLANDVRPDLPTRKCWDCGFPDNPRKQSSCGSCGKALRDRRFLVSTRWSRDLFDAYQRFYLKGIDHPGLATPVDVFVVDNVLFSVVPYNGEGLMVDEASPLPNGRLLTLSTRALGTLAYLHRHGVVVGPVTRANLLVSPDNSVRLFDIDVLEVHDEQEANDGERAQVLPSLGDLLRRYCDVDTNGLADFLTLVEDGKVQDPTTLGREMEDRYEALSVVGYNGLLGGMSDVGLTRQLNEDNWGWVRLSDRAALYVVADGMGGHDGGEVASAMAVRTLCDEARSREARAPNGEDAMENLLEESFQLANNTVKDAADAKGTDMGTTMVCVLVLENRVGFMANVGDSRGYLLRNGTLYQITKDHSLVQKMVERGRITAEEARNHPHSNILLRTVGTERDIPIDIFRIEFEPGDKVLMCSDGLWGEVEDRDMESILNTYTDPRIASRELVRAAHYGGGKDNVTLTIVTVP